MSRKYRTRGKITSIKEYEVLVGEDEVKRPPECPKCRYMIILRLILLK
jgi:hypothetical protein